MSDVTSNQFNISDIRIPNRYPNINVSYVLENVNQAAFSSGFDYNNDILTYLEFESSRYFGNTFPNATLEDLSTLYEAKVKLLEQISLQFNHTSNNWEQSETVESKRHAETLSDNSASFIPFDKQIGSAGQVSIGGFGYLANPTSCPGWTTELCGGAAGWCSKGQVYAININYPTKKSLVCLTDRAISYAVSGDKGAFTNSYWAYMVLQVNGTFTWISPGISASPLNYLETVDSYKATSLFGDFDGNGLENNMIISKPNGFTIYTTAACGTISATAQGCGGAFNIVNVSTWPNPFCKEVSSKNGFDIRAEGIRVGDFNGDGKDDLLCFNAGSGTLSFLQSTNGVLNQWISISSTSFTGVSWCQNGNIHIGDFNGDGKSDLMCFYNNQIYMMYTDSNWNFYSPVGNYNGLIPLSSAGKIPMADVSAFLTPAVVGDFDGDGYSDVLLRQYIKPSANSQSIIYEGSYILFGSKDQILESGTEYQNGKIFIGDMSNWCGLNFSATVAQNGYYPIRILWDYMVAGDYDGDGKDDLLCHREAGDNYLMLSKSLPINTVPNYQISMSVLSFDIAPVTINLSLVSTANQSVVCDNRVRPDETLTCKFSNTASSIDITRIITANGWKNFTSLLKDEIDNSYIGAVIPTYSKSSTSIPVSFYTSKYKNSGPTPNTVTSSAETLVKSGDCVKIITTTKYINDVTASYTAKGSVNIVDDNGLPFGGAALLNIAKTQIPYSVALASDNQFEAVFSISGQVTMDFIIDANSTSINC